MLLSSVLLAQRHFGFNQAIGVRFKLVTVSNIHDASSLKSLPTQPAMIPVV